MDIIFYDDESWIVKIFDEEFEKILDTSSLLKIGSKIRLNKNYWTIDDIIFNYDDMKIEIYLTEY